MCGIAGIFDTAGKRPVSRSVLERMTHSMVHRGPDEHGFFTEGGIGFGHRRLSIIDLSSGQQPLSSEDGDITVTYNGEIYNFQEIAEDLRKRGYRFRTHCDTEVIVYAWQEWGEKCVEHFRGMFAFGLYDRRSGDLFLARDRLGIKPLYYMVLPSGWLVFGSELKVLLAHPECPEEISAQSVEEFFGFGYVPDPRTIFGGIEKLPPGHRLRVSRESPVGEPEAFWDLDFRHNLPAGTEEDLAEELIDRLRQAVKVRLVADVPLGAFLSGGVDSSAVVAMMAGLSPDPVNTCSIGFDAKDHDETAYAAEVARLYKTNHNSRVVNPDDFDLVGQLSDFYDEPFADSSALPTYRVCQLARERVIVALSGDGGDELFAGYSRHRWHFQEEKVRQRMPGLMRRSLLGPLASVYPDFQTGPKLLRAKATLQALARETADAYFNTIAVVPDEIRSRLFSDSFRRQLDGYRANDVVRHWMDRAPADDVLSKVQYTDFKTYLPGDILTKVDRASMAHSLEVRVPLLDHHFIGWATGISPALRLKGREGKYIFKKALERHLPNDILYRRKMGFAVPLGAWFRGPLRERVSAAVSSERLHDTGFFNRTTLKSILDDHLEGRADNANVLWSLLMFENSLRSMEASRKIASDKGAA